MHSFPLFLLLLAPNVICDEVDSIFEILTQLKPGLEHGSNNYYEILGQLIRGIDDNLDPENISALYYKLSKEPELNYLPLSVFHMWGIGMQVDSRVAALNLHLGMLSEEPLASLAYSLKARFGSGLAESCSVSLAGMKPVVNDICRNLSLFETKNRKIVYVSEDNNEESDITVEYFISHIDDMTFLNDKALNAFMKFYITTSMSGSQHSTQKVLKHLHTKYKQEGSYEASAYMGLLYIENGGAFPRDYLKARYYSEVAARNSVHYGHLGLGIIHFYGLGVDVNYSQAFIHFSIANLTGLSECYPYLGIMYLMGLGVDADSKKALDFTMRGSSKGYLLSFYVLGLMHELGVGAFHSCNFASDVYYMLLDHKLFKPFIAQAVADYHNQHRSKALFKMLLFTEMGSSYSAVNAAYMLEKYSFPFFTAEQKAKIAFKLWLHASRLRVPRAAVKVGDYYFFGNGVKQSYRSAFDSYQLAVSQGSDVEAIFNVAYMYEHGFGVDRSYATAERYYKVVVQLDPKTSFLLHLMLLKVRLKTFVSAIRRIGSLLVVFAFAGCKNLRDVLNENIELVFFSVLSLFMGLLARIPQPRL